MINSRKIEILISLPKSLYVNYKLLPLKQAIKMPILVRYNCVLQNLSGMFSFPEEVKRFMFRMGFGDIAIFDKKFSRSILDVSGKVIVNGSVFFGHGCKISVSKNGVLELGEDVRTTAEMSLVCHHSVKIGRHVLISWETMIMDTDFHYTENTIDKTISLLCSPVIIEDNVWIGCRTTILKGSYIPYGCVVGSSSLINKKFDRAYVLLAGNPASIKKMNVTRKLSD